MWGHQPVSPCQLSCMRSRLDVEAVILAMVLVRDPSRRRPSLLQVNLFVGAAVSAAIPGYRYRVWPLMLLRDAL